VDSIAHAIGRGADVLVGLFDPLLAPWDLIGLSVVTGALVLWIVGMTTRQAWVERTRGQMAAAIYELRIFLDSPRRVLAAQGRFLWWSFGYVGSLLPGLMVASLPLGLLYAHMERRYGIEPLPVQTNLIVKVDLAEPGAGRPLAFSSASDPAIQLTAPPLHVEHEQRVYIRLAVNAPGTHRLVLQSGQQQVSKLLAAEPSPGAVLPARVGGLASMWTNGTEPPLPAGSPIESISVKHPNKGDDWMGLPLPWWMAWLLIATAAAMLLRRPMGVEI
jgi:hypothetical protein